MAPSEQGERITAPLTAPARLGKGSASERSIDELFADFLEAAEADE